MPLTFDYDADTRILRITCDGELGMNDLVQATLVITRSESHPPDVDTLWDCRRLDFGKLERGFEDRLIALRSVTPERGAARIAIVASGALDFGLSRMYELKSDRLPQRMRVFRQLEAAEAWLLGHA